MADQRFNDAAELSGLLEAVIRDAKSDKDAVLDGLNLLARADKFVGDATTVAMLAHLLRPAKAKRRQARLRRQSKLAATDSSRGGHDPSPPGASRRAN